ncbi:zinc-binding alcohol dehydrogenase family protein [Chromobacterium sp. IIBBL 290-4]|uniref:zinc-binding alcohol dehydrogenase family protein n=1 Tax=Chromobacterium sp. IIBBL 290-4 TaxID=2953890 RepID=UPI0020B72926|nr:zinc-binding alcohol dehydrogenase family protein [Chromobacterium sp. IIBBL 290-4]UTH75269.1 zinc-binding alcohol dehydrogenase family protein [Chromobacterium sp. IIBBL 290-4]
MNLLPTQMPAVGIQAPPPAELRDVFLPVPTPAGHDILVRVDAVAVNPADCRVRQRKLDDGQVVVLGWDAAGVVVACGAEAAERFRPGDAVYYAGDVNRPGCNSAYQLVDARLAARRPANWSAEEAAALPLTGLTAWEALFEHLGYAPEASAAGQTLLVLGGAGGVGSIAIQLARLAPGLRVIATASRPESVNWCRQMGAHEVIDHRQPLRPQLQAIGVEGLQSVLLLNRPDEHFAALAELMVPFGHIVNIVPFSQPPEINLLMRKSVSLSWNYMFTRSMFQTADMARQGEILADLARLAEAGRIRSTQREHLGSLSARNLSAAHVRLARGDTIGKLTLSGFPAFRSEHEPHPDRADLS